MVSAFGETQKLYFDLNFLFSLPTCLLVCWEHVAFLAQLDPDPELLGALLGLQSDFTQGRCTQYAAVELSILGALLRLGSRVECPGSVASSLVQLCTWVPPPRATAGNFLPQVPHLFLTRKSVSQYWALS